MAKTTNKPNSSKGKAKAPPSSKPTTVAAKGPEAMKGKGTTKPKGASKPMQFSSCTTMGQIVEMLRKAGADDDLVDSVGRLRLTPGHRPGSAAAAATQQDDLSQSRLVRLLVQFVQYERQVENWMETPKFLSADVAKLVGNICPPGRNEAFIKAVEAHGTDFCRAVAQTTQKHLADGLEDVRQALANWREARVVSDAAKIALRRLQKSYGTRNTAEEIKTMLQSAVDCIPRDQTRPWTEPDMEVGEATPGTSTNPS